MASAVILCFRNGKYYAGDAGPVNYSPALAEYAPGDRVTVEGGAVTGLVERKARTTVGVVRGFHAGRVYFHCPLLGSIFNPSAAAASLTTAVSIGDRVLLRLGADKSVTVIRSYGPCHDRSADWQIIDDIYTAVEEITPHPVTWGKAHYTQPYKDQTDLPTFTIDPVGSLDADDAVTVDEASRTVYVHIVDAAGQLDAGSVMDMNACRLAFTLYLVEGNHNILPKELAEDALSLVEGKPRRVITVEIRFAEEGSRISGYDIYPATICVKKRYSYDDAPAMPFLEAIDAARKRHDFCIPQVAMDVRLDTGELAATRHVYNTDAAHRNIETLMVLANMLVSKHLQERAASTMAKIPQRFHTRLGSSAGPPPPLTADPIVNSFLAIKSFAQASYQADASGHFGLGLTTYTHFTSPIRRYFDVIIHRILAGAEITDLEEQLAYINERERLVEELQRLYMMWKIVGRISVGDIWPAVTVTRVVPAGVYYLDTELMMDGFIHVSRLGNCASSNGAIRWEFADGRLCGGGRTVAVGDRVACRVDKVDHITGTLLVTALLA